MKVAYREAFRGAGLDIDKGDSEKIAVYDIYSCFPIAVEHACDCLGKHLKLDRMEYDETHLSRF